MNVETACTAVEKGKEKDKTRRRRSLCCQLSSKVTVTMTLSHNKRKRTRKANRETRKDCLVITRKPMLDNVRFPDTKS